MRRVSTALLSLLALSIVGPAATAHELWFQPSGKSDSVVRLTFGDSPAPGEAERVAEIAHAQVWADGAPMAVKRLADGLEVALPRPRPTISTAFASRGIVDFEGDSFVIQLAAYAQSRPIKADEAPSLGLDDDQLRLLLVQGRDGKPLIRAFWRGKPAADVAVELFHADGKKAADLRTDVHGELPCPDLKGGPVSLLAVLFDRTPGTLGGRSYTHTRFKATLSLEPGVLP